MEVHVLNGDALAEIFPIHGHVVVCRECLIEGPVQANDLEQFWPIRAAYLTSVYQENQTLYFQKVKMELQRLTTISPQQTINLWFEHDLFCQANMWFLLYFIQQNKLTNAVYRVMPSRSDMHTWNGFGGLSAEALINSFENRTQLTSEDIKLGVDLWKAFQRNDFELLATLSNHSSSSSFPFLKEVCQAHIDRFAENNLGRPQNSLKKIIANGDKNFEQIFMEFSRTEGIYGFGDSQVKRMLSEIK